MNVNFRYYYFSILWHLDSVYLKMFWFWVWKNGHFTLDSVALLCCWGIICISIKYLPLFSWLSWNDVMNGELLDWLELIESSLIKFFVIASTDTSMSWFATSGWVCIGIFPFVLTFKTLLLLAVFNKSKSDMSRILLVTIFCFLKTISTSNKHVLQKNTHTCKHIELKYKTL